MEKLLILSDIHGFSHCEWIDRYCTELQSKFEITLLDSLLLADIDYLQFTPDEIHEKMIKGGIKTAVDNLTKNYDLGPNLIGFSIGGTIIWKAMLGKASTTKMICVSSTRLRFEVATPHCPVFTLFGNQDKLRPDANWYNEKNLQRKTLQGDHDFYKTESGIAETIVELKRFLKV